MDGVEVVLAEQRQVRLGPAGVAGLRDGEHGPGALELGLALGGRQPGVQRIGDRAQLHQRVQEDHVLEPRRQLQGHRRAAPHAVSGQPPGGRGRLGLELLVGDARGPRRSAPCGRGRSGPAGRASCRGSSPGIIPYVPIPHKDAPSPTSSTRRSSGSAAAEFEDILYEKAEGIAKITINRPEVRNAFRPQTLAELRDAFARARDDLEVGAIILTGAGEEAFCSGGDQRIRGDDGYIGDDEVAQHGVGRLDVGDLHVQIRRTPKPVVAMVAGYAVGGGPHPAPRLRPDDRRRQRPLRPDRPPGRQLRRRLRGGAPGAQRRRQAGEGDLVPVPPLRGRRGARDGARQRRRPRSPSWSARPSPGAARCPRLSPLALRLLKASFNAAEDGLTGLQQLSHDATLLFYMTEEGQEGRNAYVEGRKPDFSKFPKRP